MSTPNELLERLSNSVKSFIKSSERLIVFLSLIFGSIVSIFTESKTLFLRYPDLIPFSIFIIFLCFALVIYLYQNNKNLNKKIKIRETQQIEIAREIGARFDFKFNEYEHIVEINADGSNTTTRKIKLFVKKETLSSLTFQTTAFGSNTLANYRVNVKGNAEKSRIDKRLIHLNAKTVFFNVDFSPALQKEAIADIEIIEKFDPGFYRMTMEEIIERIKEGNWVIDQPYEAEIVPIRYPTEKLAFKVILPKNYKISGDEFWDVVIGFSSSRAFEEYSRVKSENCFKYYEKDDTQVLEMIIDKPEISMGYCIKWKPPSKKEYERFLRINKVQESEVES